MIRKILIVTFFCIMLAGCTTTQPAEKGTLQLTSSPAGAEIYLDNQYLGSTPSTITGIGPGNHTLEFRLNGYKNWKAIVTVPSGTSNYFASLTAQPGSQQEPYNNPAETEAETATVTVSASKDRMIVGDSNIFSGIAIGTSSVTLTLFGPGYYADGIVIGQVKPDAVNSWSYTWNPGTRIQSGTYTIIVSDAGKSVSDRVQFTVIGGGIVTVTPSSYTVGTGDTVTFSGRCTSGAPSVQLMLVGPGQFASGYNLGTVSVTADQTWSLRYTTDSTMPAGVYLIYVSDVPKTTQSSSQFTIGYT